MSTTPTPAAKVCTLWEYLNVDLALLIPGGRAMAGHATPPWGQNCEAPPAPSLEPVVRDGIASHAELMQFAEAVLHLDADRDYQKFPRELRRDAPARPFVYRMLATLLCWYGDTFARGDECLIPLQRMRAVARVVFKERGDGGGRARMHAASAAAVVASALGDDGSGGPGSSLHGVEEWAHRLLLRMSSCIRTQFEADVRADTFAVKGGARNSEAVSASWASYAGSVDASLRAQLAESRTLNTDLRAEVSALSISGRRMEQQLAAMTALVQKLYAVATGGAAPIDARHGGAPSTDSASSGADAASSGAEPALSVLLPSSARPASAAFAEPAFASPASAPTDSAAVSGAPQSRAAAGPGVPPSAMQLGACLASRMVPKMRYATVWEAFCSWSARHLEPIRAMSTADKSRIARITAWLGAVLSAAESRAVVGKPAAAAASPAEAVVRSILNRSVGAAVHTPRNEREDVATNAEALVVARCRHLFDQYYKGGSGAEGGGASNAPGANRGRWTVPYGGKSFSWCDEFAKLCASEASVAGHVSTLSLPPRSLLQFRAAVMSHLTTRKQRRRAAAWMAFYAGDLRVHAEVPSAGVGAAAGAVRAEAAAAVHGSADAAAREQLLSPPPMDNGRAIFDPVEVAALRAVTAETYAAARAAAAAASEKAHVAAVKAVEAASTSGQGRAALHTRAEELARAAKEEAQRTAAASEAAAAAARVAAAAFEAAGGHRHPSAAAFLESASEGAEASRRTAASLVPQIPLFDTSAGGPDSAASGPRYLARRFQGELQRAIADHPDMSRSEAGAFVAVGRAADVQGDAAAFLAASYSSQVAQAAQAAHRSDASPGMQPDGAAQMPVQLANRSTGNGNFRKRRAEASDGEEGGGAATRDAPPLPAAAAALPDDKQPALGMPPLAPPPYAVLPLASAARAAAPPVARPPIGRAFNMQTLKRLRELDRAGGVGAPASAGAGGVGAPAADDEVSEESSEEGAEMARRSTPESARSRRRGLLDALESARKAKFERHDDTLAGLSTAELREVCRTFNPPVSSHGSNDDVIGRILDRRSRGAE